MSVEYWTVEEEGGGVGRQEACCLNLRFLTPTLRAKGGPGIFLHYLLTLCLQTLSFPHQVFEMYTVELGYTEDPSEEI